MNEKGDRYTLLLTSEDINVKIGKFTIEGADKFTMQFENKEELFATIISNIDNPEFEFDIADKENISLIEKRMNLGDYDFTLNYKHKGDKYTDLLYKKDNDFHFFRRYCFNFLRNYKPYLREVIFSDYNKKILSTKKSTQSTLNQILETLNNKNLDSNGDKFQKNIEFLYSNVYLQKNSTKTDYTNSRVGYLDTLKFVEKHKDVKKAVIKDLESKRIKLRNIEDSNIKNEDKPMVLLKKKDQGQYSINDNYYK